MMDALQNLWQLHWVRPQWLIAILPLAILLFFYSRSKPQQGWQQFIDPKLLSYLQKSVTAAQPKYLYALALAWLLGALALAGPSWEKMPVPVAKSQSATVLILDLSPSMLAEDISPNRITRAQHKLHDALAVPRDELQALIVYAGEAFLVTPLTDDASTIRSLLPSLSPRIMPLSGSNVEMAVELAIATLNDAHIKDARLVLITDGIESVAEAQLRKMLLASPFALSVLSLGDETGAPIPLGQQGFAKNSSGELVLATNQRQRLRNVANLSGGSFHDLTLDDSDIKAIFSTTQTSGDSRLVAREFDQWREQGHWLALALLPFIAFAFRRGLLLSLTLALGLLNPSFAPLTHAQQAEINQRADTDNWQKLWHNNDSRALKLLQQGQAEAAAQQFEDPRWRAAAQYKAGKFAAALPELEALTSDDKNARADDFYNLGNTLAESGELEKAIAHYDKALARAPDMEDAKFNKALAEAMLKQQQQNQQNQQDQQDQKQDSEDQQAQQSGKDGKPQDQSQTQPSDSSGSGSQQTAQAESKEAEGKKAESKDAQSEDQSELQQHADSNLPAPENDEESQSTADKATDNGEEANSDQQRAATAATTEGDERDEGDPDAAQATEQSDALAHLSPEQRQAMEQWLRQIKDDPAGLLRRKFEYQYRQRRQAQREGDWQPPENNAHQRW